MSFKRYDEWEQLVPDAIKQDVLWRMEVYRLALFAAELAWMDATKLMGDRRTFGIADQLYRATSAISADIAEGYSRRSGKDRARFYEYALGSARESRDWYFKATHVLGDEVSRHRIDYTTQIIRLLLSILPTERKATHEDAGIYTATPAALMTNAPIPD